jgi:hypothetical protein
LPGKPETSYRAFGKACFEISLSEVVMNEQQKRKDKETEAKVREAISLKYAFGDDAARKFLKLRGVDPDLAERVLAADPAELRN